MASSGLKAVENGFYILKSVKKVTVSAMVVSSDTKISWNISGDEDK